MKEIAKQKLWVYVFFLITVLLLPACSKKPDEEQIKAALSDTAQAIRDRNTSDTLEHLAEDFVAESKGYGVMDREEVRKMLTAIYFRHKKINVTITGISVEFTDSEKRYATTTFRAFATGGKGGLIPETGQAWNVSTGWRKQDDHWEIISASAEKGL